MANNDDYKDIQDMENLMDAPTPMDDDDTIEVTYQAETENGQYDDEGEDDGLTFNLDHFDCINGKLIRKGENGHADIYLVNDDCTYDKLVIKLYQPGKEPKDIGAFTRLCEVFKYHEDPKSYHLLPLIDFGYYQDSETGENRFYELSPYMEGGTLNGIPANTSAETLKDIIFSVAKAFYILHEVFEMEHGDVKLSNLFLTKAENGQILLGDYDCLTGEESHGNDLIQLSEMLKRFNVAKTQEFQKLIDKLETASEYAYSSVLIGEWFDEIEGLDSEHGTKAIHYMPYDDIVHLAEIDVSRQNRVVFPHWDTDMCTYSSLLEESGYHEQSEWVDECKVGEGCVPFSRFTCDWKEVYGLKEEEKPPRFDTLITNLDDLKTFYTDDYIKLLLRQKTLKDWIAIFFHENPWKDFSKQYSYEHEVENYLEYIRKLDPDDENVLRLDAARDSILSGSKQMTNWKWGIWFTQGLFGLLYAIPALLLIGWLVFHGLPFDGNPLTPSFATGSLVVGAIIAVGLFFLFNNDTFSSGCGCLVSAFVGAVIMLLLMWGLVNIMDAILPFIPWIVVALMLGLSFLVYCIIFSDDLKGASVNPKSDPDMWLVQPLYYAFDTSQQGYNYRQASDYQDLSDQFRSGLKKLVVMMVLPILIAWGLWLGYKSITPDLGGTKLTTVQDRLDNLAGDWTGTFGEKKATLQVLCTHRDSFKIALTVEAQQPVTQTFTGELDGLLEVDLENDTPGDDILDGSIELSMNYKSDHSLYGKFKDYLTEKKTNLSFKKVNEVNDSVQ